MAGRNCRLRRGAAENADLRFEESPVEEEIMNKMPKLFIWAALLAAVVGGISRYIMVPFLFESRVYAGAAVILLLAAIAVNTLPREQ